MRGARIWQDVVNNSRIALHAAYPEMSRLLSSLSLDKPDGRPPVRPWSSAMDR